MTDAVSQARTTNYFRQVKGSALFKGLAIAASFFAVPLTIRYLGLELYGVWSTLLSIMSWVVFFDLGIGNGLRNKLAECLAKNQIQEAAGFIASGYTWIGTLSLVLFILFAIAANFISWQVFFNSKIASEAILRNAVNIAALFILVNFWIGLINQVLGAVQKTSWIVFGQFISNALGLIFIFILIKTTDTSLPYLVISYGASVVTSNLFLNFWFYKDRSELVPSISFKPRHIHPLLSLGMQFFIIQLAVLILFTTDKILITQIFGPQSVTQYDVVSKLFSVITLFFGLISGPLWSSYTEAHHRGDLKWIKTTLRRQHHIFVLLVFATIFVGMLTKFFIKWWIGNAVVVPNSLILSMVVFIVISMWNNIYAVFLNGIGKIRMQFCTAIIAMIINVPIAIVLTRFFGFGISGIVLASSLSLLIFAIIGPIQVHMILGIARMKSTLI